MNIGAIEIKLTVNGEEWPITDFRVEHTMDQFHGMRRRVTVEAIQVDPITLLKPLVLPKAEADDSAAIVAGLQEMVKDLT